MGADHALSGSYLGIPWRVRNVSRLGTHVGQNPPVLLRCACKQNRFIGSSKGGFRPQKFEMRPRWEAGVRREYQWIGHCLGHARQACVRKTHRYACVFLHERHHCLHVVVQIEPRDYGAPQQHRVQSRRAPFAKQVLGFRQHALAGMPRRRSIATRKPASTSTLLAIVHGFQVSFPSPAHAGWQTVHRADQVSDEVQPRRRTRRRSSAALQAFARDIRLCAVALVGFRLDLRH